MYDFNQITVIIIQLLRSSLISTTGAVYPDTPVPRTLVRTPDAVHRGHRSGGAGMCGAHGAGGK